MAGMRELSSGLEAIRRDRSSLGSARVSRAGFGVSPERTSDPARLRALAAQKFAYARRIRPHARRVLYPAQNGGSHEPFINSATMCSLSAALPPLPHTSSLFSA